MADCPLALQAVSPATLVGPSTPIGAAFAMGREISLVVIAPNRLSWTPA
jgi:hypothetical protein